MIPVFNDDLLKHHILDCLFDHWVQSTSSKYSDSDALFLPIDEIRRRVSGLTSMSRYVKCLQLLYRDECVESTFPLEGNYFVRYRLKREGEKALSDKRYYIIGAEDRNRKLMFYLTVIGVSIAILTYMKCNLALSQ